MGLRDELGKKPLSGKFKPSPAKVVHFIDGDGIDHPIRMNRNQRRKLHIYNQGRK